MMSIQKDGASAFLVGLRTLGCWLIFEPTVLRSRPQWISRVRRTVRAPFQAVAPSLCPAEIACLLMASSFRACRYSEVTRQGSLPSSHRSRSSHQTCESNQLFFQSMHLLCGLTVRATYAFELVKHAPWVYLFEGVKINGVERTIRLRLTAEERQDGIGRNLLKELLQCGPALFPSDGVASRGLSSCRCLLYGVTGRYVFPIAFSAGNFCANGRCLCSAARWRHWLPYGRSRGGNGRWRLHDVCSTNTGRVWRVRFPCPCFHFLAAGPQC